MIDDIRASIKINNLIDIGDKIVVAVSGGADSICLLHVLYSLMDEFKLQLFAAHLNHNFRGIDAQRDAQYVAKFCDEYDIISFIKSMDVAQYAKEHGLSDEEAGRVLRYEFFEEIAEKVGATKIAVAHNQNDQAETVLMRLLRGTGIQGLTAIHHQRGRIIRPLLDTSRKDIEDYCLVHKLFPRIDATNLEPIYHRNKIRLELIPYIEEHYNPNIIQSLAKTAEILKKDNDFMEEAAWQAYGQVKLKMVKGCIDLSIEALNKLPHALQSRILRLATKELVGQKEALEFKHIYSIIELLARNETGKKILLPKGIVAKTSYHKLILTTQDQDDYENFYYELPEKGSLIIDETRGEFITSVLARDRIKTISRDKYIKYFDYDNISDNLNVRNRREGDRFWPLGLTGSKKLKDFFIDYKIDRDKRNAIPLVCHGDEVIWVVGYRISEKYKISKNTSRVLAIEYKVFRDGEQRPNK